MDWLDRLFVWEDIKPIKEVREKTILRDTCLFCGENMIIGTSPNPKIYCSVSCRVRAYNKRTRKP